MSVAFLTLNVLMTAIQFLLDLIKETAKLLYLRYFIPCWIFKSLFLISCFKTLSKPLLSGGFINMCWQESNTFSVLSTYAQPGMKDSQMQPILWGEKYPQSHVACRITSSSRSNSMWRLLVCQILSLYKLFLEFLIN